MTITLEWVQTQRFCYNRIFQMCVTQVKILYECVLAYQNVTVLVKVNVACGSGQVWGHAPEQRVAASTLRRYSFGLRLAIAQADARPVMPVSFR